MSLVFNFQFTVFMEALVCLCVVTLLVLGKVELIVFPDARKFDLVLFFGILAHLFHAKGEHLLLRSHLGNVAVLLRSANSSFLDFLGYQLFDFIFIFD